MPVRDKFDSNAANSKEAIENAAQVVSGFEICDMARILPRRFGASQLVSGPTPESRLQNIASVGQKF